MRQILAWRELHPLYLLYWNFMPKYAESNFFKFKDKFPNFYWTGENKMNHISYVVKLALPSPLYSHHTQRLMIASNLACSAPWNRQRPRSLRMAPCSILKRLQIGQAPQHHHGHDSFGDFGIARHQTLHILR